MYTFSVKAMLASHKKEDGTKRVYLQAIIDRRPARVPLGFYVDESLFARGWIKSAHMNAASFNAEIQMAITKANEIASKFRIQKKRLTPDAFREEFENPSDEIDLLKYMRDALNLRAPELQPNTIKQHNSVIRLLSKFQKKIPFGDLNPDWMQRFKNSMIAKNKNSTIDKKLKIVKQYLDDAAKKGHEFTDPFVMIKIKTYRSNRLSLTESEIHQIEKYYQTTDKATHAKTLRYFLFSCYTGLRISDVKEITWANIHNEILIYTPVKTKGMDKTVSVPITRERKYLPKFKEGKEPIFETYSDQATNRYLKEIAATVGIKKHLTYHISRHTFGSLMAEGGHLPETQKMMGHGSIRTTMEYVHTNVQNLIKAKRKRFGK